MDGVTKTAIIMFMSQCYNITVMLKKNLVMASHCALTCLSQHVSSVVNAIKASSISSYISTFTRHNKEACWSENRI